MEKISLIVGAIAALLTGLSKVPIDKFINIINKKRKVSYPEIVKHIDFFNVNDNSYSSEILMEIYKKKLFEDLTGIYTSSKRHKNILNFINRFENEYGRLLLKRAFEFVVYDNDDKIIFKIRKIEYIFNYYLIIATIYLFFVSGYFFYLLTFFPTINSQTLIYLGIALIFIVIALIIFRKIVVFFRIVGLKNKISNSH